MRVGLLRRLGQLEKQMLPPVANYGGSIEVHFTEAGLQDRGLEGQVWHPCSEHGSACRVAVTELPWTRLRRVIVMGGKPCLLG